MNALFAVDENARTVKGRLLPFGELSAPSVSGADPVMFAAGVVQVPADPDVMTFNRAHSQFEPIGRATTVTTQTDGIYAEFRIARTPEGDAALDDIRSGRVKALSAELRDLVRDGVTATFAKLTGAALVPAGAFAGAHLFAAQTPDEDTPSTDNTEEDIVTNVATLPEGVASPAGDEKTDTSETALFAAVAHRDATALAQFDTPDNEKALFEIATIQHSGPSTVTIGADTQDPGYLGELWKRNPYQRKFVPLFNQEPLTSYKAYGWRWTTEPDVDSYAGNVAEIPSGTVDTEQVSADALRIAGGHRIDRRYLDFNDQAVIASYFRLMTEDYSRKVDAAVLAAAVTAAGSDLTVTGTSYPYGQPVALAAIVDGALDVIASENTPTFAVVHPALWRDIVLIGQKDVLGYLNAGFGLEAGSLDGFRIIPGAVGSGKVLVGSKNALTVYELSGTPIRVEGLAPHHGAIDPALYGYYATIVNNAAAVSIVDTTDYTAPTPPTVVVEGE